jgi:hypothetical protein
MTEKIPEINFIFSGQIRMWDQLADKWLKFSHECEDFYNTPVNWYGHAWADPGSKIKHQDRFIKVKFDDQQKTMKDWINRRFLHRIMYTEDLRNLKLENVNDWLETIYQETIRSFGQHYSFALAVGESFLPKISAVNVPFLGCKLRWDIEPAMHPDEKYNVMNSMNRVYSSLYSTNESKICLEPSISHTFSWGRSNSDRNMLDISMSMNETFFFFNENFSKPFAYPDHAMDLALDSYYHNANRYDTHTMWAVIFAKHCDVMNQFNSWKFKIVR